MLLQQQKQSKQLRAWCLSQKPKRIIIALDGEVSDDHKRKLAKAVASVAGDALVMIADLPDEKDPEEVVAAGELSNVFNNLRVYKE